MFTRDAGSWQLILADLALILFLVTAAAITDEAEGADDPPEPKSAADVPAQAIYRPRGGAPDIDEWLSQQNPDDRMSLTIVATHTQGDAKVAWAKASALAQSARGTGIAVRVIMREGSEGDLYASLGYDNVK